MEVWVDTEQQKDELFNRFKGALDDIGIGKVTWHECYHWSGENVPCVIQETYEVE
jgi:hypothetical protein